MLNLAGLTVEYSPQIDQSQLAYFLRDIIKLDSVQVKT